MALKSITMSKGMSFGINVNYLSIYYHPFNIEDCFNTRNAGFFRLDIKIGPSFSYSSVNKLVFDAFIKADFNWVIGAAFIEDQNIEITDQYACIFAVGLSTGTNIHHNDKGTTKCSFELFLE